MSKNAMKKLMNPNIIKNIKIGMPVYVYDSEHAKILNGTITSINMDMAIVQTKQGRHIYRQKELWLSEDDVKKALGITHQPIETKKTTQSKANDAPYDINMTYDIRNIKDLLSFCIHTDFETENANDKKDVVSAKSIELLGFDPFKTNITD